MTNERTNPTTEAAPGSSINANAGIQHANPTAEAAAGGPTNPNAGVQPATGSIDAEVSLASYVETLAPDDFTVAAKAAAIAEIREFATELCDKTKTFQQLDEGAENALRKHVLEASRSMRQGKQAKDSKGADWCKWIGFGFLAFMVQQFNRVAGEKVILRGSVNWLAADIIIALAFLVIGFVIDKPFAAATKVFRKKT